MCMVIIPCEPCVDKASTGPQNNNGQVEHVNIFIEQILIQYFLFKKMYKTKAS